MKLFIVAALAFFPISFFLGAWMWHLNGQKGNTKVFWWFGMLILFGVYGILYLLFGD